MTRTLTILSILAAVAALAVSAVPVASAGTSHKPPSRTQQVVVLIGANDYGLVSNGHAGLGARLARAPQSGPTGSAPASSQGIIMRDGGVCDPIRHMGC